ncbi:MAG: electron transfer flavoprotein subunit alpha/FixB family protein [Ilumatobacteraceae bacterium]|nr:electron transfer flavoprotein subunit alpha/FixB family protein [Acidimicrobiales bacterium]MCB9393886.1 electron transfer flavoprotein subunit alpha/FixB family protein [Acidimicrobiaceae bacterium]
MSVLVVVEHDRGTIAPATLEACVAARALGEPVHALTIGVAADGLVDVLAEHGVSLVVRAHHDLLADYGPEAWGETVAHEVRRSSPSAVVATGTDRGNEVMAQAAARLDLPFVANCTEITPGEPWSIQRVRWGGSLLERCTLTAPVKLVTVAHHTHEASPAPASVTTETISPELDASLARTVVAERVERAAGVTLATAPLVVGGGRGVGSADGFGPLEELAAELGGVVGCSRAVTNNGWRNHTDQVGQTGTRIAPDLYIACGISGAIQHWVGAMASKKILAINTDAEANMVTKADYAVIGDLHQVVPAITAEIRRRRTG